MRSVTQLSLTIFSLLIFISFALAASAQNSPVAIPAGNPNPAGCGQPVEFDGSGSFHENPLGNIVEYEWDFDFVPGSFSPQEFGPFAIHEFPAFGTFTVALRVTDDTAQTDLATLDMEIILGNNPPLAVAGGPYVVEMGTALILDGSASTDPDEECGDAIVEFAWDLDDDGTFEIGGESPIVPWDEISTLPQPDIPNPINLRVTDTFGNFDFDQTTLAISHSGPPVAVINGNPNPAACNQPIEFDGTASYHLNPMHNITDWHWDFDYTPGDFTMDDAGPFVLHAFPAFGNYDVALRVFDDSDPPQSDLAILTLEVSLGNNPPLADAGGPYLANFGMTVELDGSGSVDPDEQCGDSIVAFSWDIDNDGTYETSGVTPTIPWSALAGLPQPGVPNPIQLRVSDSLGVYDFDQTTITIYNSEPVAEILMAPNPAAHDQPISFDGTGSYHANPERTIVEWRWDFSFDGNFHTEDFGPMVEHAFPTSGTHTIALQVVDDSDPPLMDLETGELEIFAASGIADGSVPVAFHLYQNTPNPFNPMTTIHYDVPENGGLFKIRLYDVQGRFVGELANGNQTAGHKSVVWSGKNSRGETVSSGVYYVVLQAPEFRQVRKLTLLQ